MKKRGVQFLLSLLVTIAGASPTLMLLTVQKLFSSDNFVNSNIDGFMVSIQLVFFIGWIAALTMIWKTK